MNKKRTELNKELNVIDFYCKKCKKSMKVSYMVTGNRNYPVLPRVMLKCHHYARHWSKAKVVKIMLPTLDGKTPNYKYMDEYISSLRMERIDVLKEYLKLRGINEDELSESELLFLGTDKDILAALNKKLSEASWGEYLIGSLFEKVETKKMAYKAKDLPDKPQGNYKLPCLTSSFRNQGLNYYVLLDDATIIKNVISIPSKRLT